MESATLVPARQETTASSSGILPHTVAAIAAAVHFSFGGRRHRIAAMVEMRDVLDWAREGRRLIFASHKMR